MDKRQGNSQEMRPKDERDAVFFSSAFTLKFAGVHVKI